MGRLGIVAGSGLTGHAVVDGTRRVVEGVALVENDAAVLLARHGLDTHALPHAVDHPANARALHAAGVDRVLGLASVGSLRLDWPVGTCVCPDDFYAPHVNVSVYDDGRAHGVPGFDPSWRRAVLEVWTGRGSTPLVDGGVYGATRGPRFETPAEVRALARVADLVGMTIAGECIVMREVGIRYAAVCVVDNLGNGLAPDLLTMEAFRAGVDANRTRLLADLDQVIPALATA